MVSAATLDQTGKRLPLHRTPNPVAALAEVDGPAEHGSDEVRH
jgi:hypothetical protein